MTHFIFHGKPVPVLASRQNLSQLALWTPLRCFTRTVASSRAYGNSLKNKLRSRGSSSTQYDTFDWHSSTPDVFWTPSLRCSPWCGLGIWPRYQSTCHLAGLRAESDIPAWRKSGKTKIYKYGLYLVNSQQHLFSTMCNAYMQVVGGGQNQLVRSAVLCRAWDTFLTVLILQSCSPNFWQFCKTALSKSSLLCHPLVSSTV